MKEFDIEKLERKNIYEVPDDLFATIQNRVMHDVKAHKKAPVFKLNWAYAAAASLALIFGATFVFNSYNETKDTDNQKRFAVNSQKQKTESEVAYETLKADLTSVENTNQRVVNQVNKTAAYIPDEDNTKQTAKATVKPVSKQTEAQMNEYLDSFTNTEIAELASNSTQDVYLDLYN